MLLNLPAVAQTNEQVAKEVIAIAKAQWAAQSGKKPASVWMKNIAEEYTEFNLDSPMARHLTVGSVMPSPVAVASL